MPKPKKSKPKSKVRAAKLAKKRKPEKAKRSTPKRSTPKRATPKRIASKPLPKAEQDKREAALRSPTGTSSSKPPADRDPRLPPVGDEIRRTYKGEVVKVLCLANGFELLGHFADGVTYRGLSGVAKAITKCEVNGFAWFGLVPRATPKSKASKAA